MARRHAPGLLARGLRLPPARLAEAPTVGLAPLVNGGLEPDRRSLGAQQALAVCSQPSRGFCLSGVARQSEPQPVEDAERESAGNDASTGDAFLDGITMRSGPAAYYKEHRLSGLYKKDPRQEGTILKLQELYEGLLEAFNKGRRRRSGLTVVDHAGTQDGHASWWQGISSFLKDRGGKAQEAPQRPPVRGLYMFGGVGTGKTMLMDLLVHSAPPQFKLKRQHFHDFMLDVHSQLRAFASQEDPLLRVADATAGCTRVLCLDELFVTDVADAAILSRLFGRLWDRGVVLVATSNRHPDELYKGGLQRELFLPFIERLKAEAEVHDMASPTDYRKLAQHRNGVFFTPAQHLQPDAALAAAFDDLVATAGGSPQPASVPVQMGRTLRVPVAGAGMCLAQFSELCGGNLGAADYLALAGAFHTLALQGVPIFGPASRPAAYRFVTLIDVLYERRLRLFASAAGRPAQLFERVVTQQEAARIRGDADGLIVDDNLAFSKDRTVSRLTEMEGAEYLLAHARAHAPCLVLALEEENDPARRPRSRERLAA